jgi:hypothetical protein
VQPSPNGRQASAPSAPTCEYFPVACRGRRGPHTKGVGLSSTLLYSSQTLQANEKPIQAEIKNVKKTITQETFLNFCGFGLCVI